MVNDACVLAGKPLVYGSIFQFEGQASFFHPAAGAPCYRCLFPAMPDPATVPNCAEAGVVGALAGMIGSIQALETIKWATGIGRSLAGRLLVVNSATMETRTLRIKRDPRCPVCSPPRASVASTTPPTSGAAKPTTL
jgi:adenylyltransferase/sulfurtransferase